MIGLALEIGEWDEERKIGVLDAGGLDAVIHQALVALPDAIAPRLDHHAAAHSRFFGEIGGGDDLLIPFSKVVFALHIERVPDV